MSDQSAPSPKIQMNPVKSSNIAEIGHDPETSTMHVTFSNGTTYAYDGVSADDHAAFAGSDSPGSHFAKNIRGKFEGRKL